MGGLLAAILLASSAALLRAAELPAELRLDLGVDGSPVQAGWIGWSVGPGHNWDHRGPVSYDAGPMSFDSDGFRVTLGPEGGLGYRQGPMCTGPRRLIIEENVFSWADRSMRISISGLAKGTYRIVTWHNDSRVRPAAALVARDRREWQRTGCRCRMPADRHD